MFPKWFQPWKGLVYAGIAGWVLTYAAGHPVFHDPAMIFLGIFAHQLGVDTGGTLTNGTNNKAD